MKNSFERANTTEKKTNGDHGINDVKSQYGRVCKRENVCCLSCWQNMIASKSDIITAAVHDVPLNMVWNKIVAHRILCQRIEWNPYACVSWGGKRAIKIWFAFNFIASSLTDVRFNYWKTYWNFLSIFLFSLLFFSSLTVQQLVTGDKNWNSFRLTPLLLCRLYLLLQKKNRKKKRNTSLNLACWPYLRCIGAYAKWTSHRFNMPFNMMWIIKLINGQWKISKGQIVLFVYVFAAHRTTM